MNIGLPSSTPPPVPTPLNTCTAHNDTVSKQRMSAYHNTPTCSSQDSSLVTMCLCNSPRRTNCPPLSLPVPIYFVTQKKGSMVTVRRSNNTIIVRNSSYFKHIQGVTPKLFDDEEEEEEDDPVCTETIPNPLYTDPQLQQQPEPAAVRTPRSEPAAVPTPRARTTPPRPLTSTPAQTFRTSVPTTLHTSTLTPAIPGPVPRPAQQRKRPAYLEDYDTN